MILEPGDSKGHDTNHWEPSGGEGESLSDAFL